MYCNYYKGENGRKDWFSLTLDTDEIGIEVLTIMKNTFKKNLTEAINVDNFEASRKLFAMTESLEEALEEAKNAKDKPEDTGE